MTLYPEAIVTPFPKDNEDGLKNLVTEMEEILIVITILHEFAVSKISFIYPVITFVCFVFFQWTPSEGKKWVSHKGFCLTSRNRTNVATSLSRVNPNTVAARNQTRCLAQHQTAMQTSADKNSVCVQRNSVARTAPD